MASRNVAGSAEYQVGADLTPLRKDLKKAEGWFRSSGLSSGKTYKRAIGTAIGVGGGIIAANVLAKGFSAVKGAIGGAISTAADFDAAMTKSTAIMGDLSDTMREDMADAAREVAKSTLFSAEQAADAYYFLASAGLDAAQSIEAMPKVAEFATAGMFDLSRATDLLTDAQSALGLTVDDTAQNVENMTRVSDVLVRANTLANASVEQFSTALTSKAGAALKAFGIDLEEGVAVLAAFADQGVKAEEAGNALDRILRLLPDLALRNADAFRKFGIEVFDSQGEVNNLGVIIDQLTAALAGMSDQQVQTTLTALGFQARVQGIVKPLLGTGKAIGKYEKALREAGGTTEDVAEKQLDNFNAKMAVMGSWVEDIAIDLGGALVDGLVAAGDALGAAGTAIDRFVQGGAHASLESALVARNTGYAEDAILDMVSALRAATLQAEANAAILQETGVKYDVFTDNIDLAAISLTEETQALIATAQAAAGLTKEQKELNRAVLALTPGSEAMKFWSGLTSLFRATGDAADGAADDIAEAADALQHFKDNIDDFSDVKSLDQVEKAMRRQRVAIKQAVREGDYAAWARHKAKMRELNDERKTSQAAKDAFDASVAQQQGKRRQIRQTNRIIDRQAARYGVSARKVRRILEEEGGDVDALKTRLRQMADGTYVAEAEVETSAATRAIERLKTALASIEDEQVYIDIQKRGGRAGSGSGTGSTHLKLHAGGPTEPNRDYVIRQGEAWLSTGQAPGRVVPLDQMARQGASSAPTALTINVNAGAFLGLPEDAQRLGRNLTPIIKRELDRLALRP